MSTDEQRRPSTEAGRHFRRLLVDMFTAWQQFEDVEPVADPTGLILAIEAEAGAERDRLEAALRKAREQLLIEHGHDSDSNANWPACRFVHPVLDEARVALGDG